MESRLTVPIPSPYTAHSTDVFSLELAGADLNVRHRPPRRWRVEAAYFLGAYLVYVTARWVFAGDAEAAQRNAAWIWDLELATGTAIEGSVQQAFSSEAASVVLSNVYLAAQIAVLPLSIVWLYRRSPLVYRKFRTTIIATWMISVPIFALFPVAPPRLAALGLADTVSDQAAVALTGSSTMFYNPFAAVPSLHVGFAFAIGVAVAFAARSRWLKALAVLWGPVVTLTVVATANHYVFDVLVGLVVTLAGFAVWYLREHRPERPAALTHRTRSLGSRPAGPMWTSGAHTR